METAPIIEAQAAATPNIDLLEGESIDTVFHLRDGLKDGPVGGGNVLYLTNRRLILAGGSGRKRRSSFASVQDIDLVDIVVDRRGLGAYLWAGLAVVVAVLLWRAIDHPVGAVAAAASVVLMGAYLVVDKLTAPGRSLLTFRVGPSELRCELSGDGATADVNVFVNRVFQVKETESQRRSDRNPGPESGWDYPVYPPGIWPRG